MTKKLTIPLPLPHPRRDEAPLWLSALMIVLVVVCFLVMWSATP
jgi:hypothetical protein